jgi:hypothetical protein
LRVEYVAVVKEWEIRFGGIGNIGHEASVVEFFGHFLKKCEVIDSSGYVGIQW